MFSIVQFVSENRSRGIAPLFDVQMLLESHPGEMGFICRRCYQDEHRIVVQNGSDPQFCSRGVHQWFDSRILFHYSPEGLLTLIGRRIHTAKNAFFLLCRYQHYCNRRWNNTCYFAHSLIERNIWCVERDFDLTQDQIVEKVSFSI
jgi:hypothetical protein